MRTIFESGSSSCWIGSFLLPLLVRPGCLDGGRYPRGESPPPLQTSCFIQRHSLTIITLHSVSSTSWHSFSRISLQVLSITCVQTESETSPHTSSCIVSHFSTSVVVQDSSSTSSQTSSKKRSQNFSLLAVILLYSTVQCTLLIPVFFLWLLPWNILTFLFEDLATNCFGWWWRFVDNVFTCFLLYRLTLFNIFANLRMVH